MIDLCDNLFDIYIIHELTDHPLKWGYVTRESNEKKEKTLRNPTSGAESACVRGTWLYYV